MVGPEATWSRDAQDTDGDSGPAAASLPGAMGAGSSLTGVFDASPTGSYGGVS